MVEAQTIPISVILRSPGNYYGKHVFVSGTVTQLSEESPQKGIANSYDRIVFQICNSGCLRVLWFGKSTLLLWDAAILANGEQIIVPGTFVAVKRMGRDIFRNAIEADGLVSNLRPAYFTSSVTGPILLQEFGGDKSPSTNPNVRKIWLALFW